MKEFCLSVIHIICLKYRTFYNNQNLIRKYWTYQQRQKRKLMISGSSYDDFNEEDSKDILGNSKFDDTGQFIDD